MNQKRWFEWLSISLLIGGALLSSPAISFLGLGMMIGYEVARR